MTSIVSQYVKHYVRLTLKSKRYESCIVKFINSKINNLYKKYFVFCFYIYLKEYKKVNYMYFFTHLQLISHLQVCVVK